MIDEHSHQIKLEKKEKYMEVTVYPHKDSTDEPLTCTMGFTDRALFLELGEQLPGMYHHNACEPLDDWDFEDIHNALHGCGLKLYCCLRYCPQVNGAHPAPRES